MNSLKIQLDIVIWLKPRSSRWSFQITISNPECASPLPLTRHRSAQLNLGLLKLYIKKPNSFLPVHKDLVCFQNQAVILFSKILTFYYKNYTKQSRLAARRKL